MRLSKEATKEFKEIYQKEFGEEISDEKAQEMGENLLLLFKIIYRQIPSEKDKQETNHNPGLP